MRVSNTPRRHTRSRNNSGRRNNTSPKNRYENNNDNKITGNAIQVHEKYQSLARDAISSGDIVKAEYYFQHAEHYHRVHKSVLNTQLDKQQKSEKNIVHINKEEVKENILKTNDEAKNNTEEISKLLLNEETKKKIKVKNQTNDED